MQIVFLIKPYSIHMYSYANDAYELLGTQDISTIENEDGADYENRVIYVCKDIAQDLAQTGLFKKERKNIQSMKVVLTNPWCVYEIMNLEKKLEKPQKIDQKLIDSLLVHKDIENVSILKNSIFNISLNGYNVQKLDSQVADTVHLQYISVYSSTNFLTRLRNTLETIFHLHDIEIDSIYSYINENHQDDKSDNQLKIIIEDYGLDLSYTHNGKNISTLFIPCGSLSIKNKVKEALHIDDILLDKILKSKSLSLSAANLTFAYDKTLNNIWLDLDPAVKGKIDQVVDEQLNDIKSKIRDFIDHIEHEFISKETGIIIYTLDEKILFSTGFILAFAIRNDAYILGKLATTETNIFTKKIF